MIQRYPVPPVPGGERFPHRGGAGVHGRLGPQERQGHPAAPQALTQLRQYQRDIRQREGHADILKMHSMYSTLVTSLELTGLDAVLKEGGRTREMGC